MNEMVLASHMSTQTWSFGQIHWIFNVTFKMRTATLRRHASLAMLGCAWGISINHERQLLMVLVRWVLTRKSNSEFDRTLRYFARAIGPIDTWQLSGCDTWDILGYLGISWDDAWVGSQPSMFVGHVLCNHGILAVPWTLGALDGFLRL